MLFHFLFSLIDQTFNFSSFFLAVAKEKEGQSVVCLSAFRGGGGEGKGEGNWGKPNMRMQAESL